MAILSVRLYKIPTDQKLNWFFSLFQIKNEIITDIKYDEKEYKLHSLIRNLKWDKNFQYFEGLFAYEILKFVKNLDGSRIATVEVEEAPFIFIEGSMFLLVFARKDIAETTANRLNQLIGGSVIIKNCSFTTNDIEQFLEENEHIIKRCYWKGLRIPGVNRANLDGSNIKRSVDYTRYDELGDKNYIWLELLDEKITITLSSSGAVGFVSDMTREGALDFIRRKIFPLIWT